MFQGCLEHALAPTPTSSPDNARGRAESPIVGLVPSVAAKANPAMGVLRLAAKRLRFSSSRMAGSGLLMRGCWRSSLVTLSVMKATSYGGIVAAAGDMAAVVGLCLGRHSGAHSAASL